MKNLLSLINGKLSLFSLESDEEIIELDRNVQI